MKIRNHRKHKYYFYPHEDSDFTKHVYIFKYKSDLMKFLRKTKDSLGGIVRLNENNICSNATIREYYVWYNAYNNKYKNAKFKIVLKQLTFRNKKYIFKPNKIPKSTKKYLQFSDKVIRLMCNIENDGKILKKDAVRLVKLFEKSGFKDFKPTTDEWAYINGHIKDGICFFHWSDRCNWLRTKTIIEYFKRENLI